MKETTFLSGFSAPEGYFVRIDHLLTHATGCRLDNDVFVWIRSLRAIYIEVKCLMKPQQVRSIELLLKKIGNLNARYNLHYKEAASDLQQLDHYRRREWVLEWRQRHSAVLYRPAMELELAVRKILLGCGILIPNVQQGGETPHG